MLNEFSTPRMIRPEEEWAEEYTKFNGYLSSAYEFIVGMLGNDRTPPTLDHINTLYAVREKAHKQNFKGYFEYVRIAQVVQMDGLKAMRQNHQWGSAYFETPTDIDNVRQWFLSYARSDTSGYSVTLFGRALPYHIDKEFANDLHYYTNGYRLGQTTLYYAVDMVMHAVEVAAEKATRYTFEIQRTKQKKGVETPIVVEEEELLVDPIQAVHHYFFGRDFVDTDGLLPTDDAEITSFKLELLERLKPIKA